MSNSPAAQILTGASVHDEVYALRPDYRVILLTATGLEPGASDETSEQLLSRAEESARDALRDVPIEEVPAVAAWRDAYRLFGAKPQRTRNSLEALMRRAPEGMPRINRLTDIYNALSVIHQIPLGGEDLANYAGSPALIRATGEEEFDTMASGETVIEHPEAGEVVWTDPAGVTCRRWNWRQCRRTALTEATTEAIFILDALDPMSDDALSAVADDLATHLGRLGPDVQIEQRLLRR